MRRLASSLALVAALTVAAAATSHAQDVVDGFVGRSFTGANGVTMPYRLFVPDARARVNRLPVVIYLHGSGGAGTDNLRQITGGNTSGTHLWIGPDIQARHPAFVLAPQLPGEHQWSAPDSDEVAPYAGLVLELLATLSREFAIDPDRVYLTGQSRGGRGTWDLVSKRPELFAAAVPLCGDGNAARIAAARRVAIWAFHGAKDETVPVAGSRELVAALRAAGSAVKYTEYPDAGHNVWTLAFADRDLPDWLFGQRRAR
jgi:predicted peptidase